MGWFMQPVRDSTNSHNELPPPVDGMVERFHRQLKAAIMAHESMDNYTTFRFTWRSFRR